MNQSHHAARRGFLRRMLRSRDGATAVETAIVLPMVLWLVMAIIEMGIVFHIASLANYATNESARLSKTGGLYGASGTREQLVFATMNKYLGQWVREEGDLQLATQSYGDFNDFSAAGTPGAGGAGDIVLYTATYNWKIFTPIFAQIIGDGGVFAIKSRVIMKNENF